MVNLNVIQLLAILIVPNLTLLISFVTFTRVSFAKQEGQMQNLADKVKGLEEKVGEKDSVHKATMSELKYQQERELEKLNRSLEDINKKIDSVKESVFTQLMELSKEVAVAVKTLQMVSDNQKHNHNNDSHHS